MVAKITIMFFWNKICVIGFFFFICCAASAQVNGTPGLKGKDFISKNSVKTSGYLIGFTSTLVAKKHLQTISHEPPLYRIPQNFSTCNFGFFCKQELHVEKAIKIPLRFRLGSLQQCNYYEGKK